MRNFGTRIDPRTNAVTIHIVNGRPAVSIECKDENKLQMLQDYARKIFPLLPAPDPQKPRECYAVYAGGTHLRLFGAEEKDLAMRDCRVQSDDQVVLMREVLPE